MVAVPLAQWTLFTHTTVGDAGFVDHPQTASFRSALLEEELLASRAPDRSIGLESKVFARIPSSLPWAPDDRWLVTRRRPLPGFRRVESRSKLGGA